jgi:preprotein translocase subunit SecD
MQLFHRFVLTFVLASFWFTAPLTSNAQAQNHSISAEAKPTSFHFDVLNPAGKPANSQEIRAVIQILRKRVDLLGNGLHLQFEIKPQSQLNVLVLKRPQACPPLETELAYLYQAPEKILELLQTIGALDFRQLDVANREKWVSTPLNGSDIVYAQATMRSNNDWVVEIDFSEAGGQKMAQLTKTLEGQPLGIFLDDLLVSAPQINTPITNGVAVIQGAFNQAEAQLLALKLNSGKLPALLKERH